jgi:hypothetical protein
MRSLIKAGFWNGFQTVDQAENPEWLPPSQPNQFPVDALRYIDMLEYRLVDVGTQQKLQGVPLNGSDPPIIVPHPTTPASIWQLDTPMIEHFGRRVVREPFPEKFLASYDGYDPVTFLEKGMAATPGNPTPPPGPPGVLYGASTTTLPLRVHLKAPDGTSIKVDPTDPDPFAEVHPDEVIDRLPLIHPANLPPSIGHVSRGTSRWLDFNGVAVRARDAAGLAPPHFTGLNGTYSAFTGTIPLGKEGQVKVANPVPTVPGDTPAHFVAETGPIPIFDPGVCPNLGFASPPKNDVKVDAPEYGIENAITDNATVSLHFQGAFPIRAGSHVPDPASLSGWVADLRELSGFPLVRFRVTFDLAKDENYPFGPASQRPGVDRLRIRARY